MPFESRELKLVLHSRDHLAQKISELFCCVHRRMGVLADMGGGWDVIYLDRELLPIGSPVLERLLIRKGIPIVYDFDDAIFLPDVSDANRPFKWLKWPQETGEICQLSAHVIGGNDYLKAYALQSNRHVSVVPTTIDTDTYTPKGSVKIRGLPVIGWSGSLTTLKHLRTVETALQALKKSAPFRLKVLGSPDFFLPGLDVESKGWDAGFEVSDLKSFDVGIMPLPDDEWSRGKCELKALQYMAVGVPVVASPVGVNSQIIEDGKNGFLAASETGWVEKLSLLLSDEDLRRRFAKEGRRTVEERYSAKVHAPRVLEILEQVGRTKKNFRVNESAAAHLGSHKDGSTL
ncbi:MAG: glycosyltransferase [Deltaproteobacteria bacterium]|nr:glycosyltransferase [Deltaproteobacteria bacterium]